MKKLVFTMAALVALSLTTNAQTELKKTEAKPAENKVAVAPDGTAKAETNPAKTKTEEPKKSGTRMAINEKGLPGEKKAKKTDATNPK